MPLSAVRPAKPKERGRSAGSPDPPALPQLCQAAGRGGRPRGAGLGGGVRVPGAGQLPAEGDLHPPAARPGFCDHTGVVAAAGPGGGWPDPALAIRYLPGKGGPSPAGGFKMHGRTHAGPAPRDRPGRPGHADLRCRPRARDAAHPARRRPGPGVACAGPARRAGAGPAVLASAGSFAAISTLLGSPLSARSCSWRPPVWAARCSGWSWCPACWPRASGPWSSWAWTPGPGWARFPWPSPACRISAARRGRVRLGGGHRRGRPVDRLGHPLARHAACIPTPNGSRCW